jgi:hypothetical protein
MAASRADGILGRSKSPVTVAHLRIALLYKYAALLRGAWVGEALDLTPQGITTAHAYFRTGAFVRRPRFLRLAP